MWERVEGHVWTLWPHVARRLDRSALPPAEDWSTTVATERGRVVLTGAWSEEASTTAVLVIHGLGGGIDRPYALRAARACAQHGWSCLRLALRGADRRGEDFYHAGLTDDVRAALEHPAFFGYERLAIVGYSLGGHVALRYATESPDPRLVGVAAVCAPLDLAAGADHLDAPGRRFYRRHVLRGLREMYEEVALRGPVPTDPAALERVDSIRKWDALTVVPRHGFASVDDYYESQSVGPRLSQLATDAFLVYSEHDPMIEAAAIRAQLDAAPSRVESWWLSRGGHVGFPASVRYGPQGQPGVESQILHWFEGRG